jgi:hypothetical protein
MQHLSHLKKGIRLLIILVAVTFYCKSQSPTLDWAKQLGGPNFEDGRSVTVDASGNVYSAGYFQSTADFDPGTGTFTLASFGSNDIYVSKLDATGNFLWAKQLGGTAIDEAYALTLDASGNIYITGRFDGLADFDPGPGTYTLLPAGGSSADIFVCKLDGSGNFVWAKGMGAPSNNDLGYAIKVDGSGNVYTTGEFSGTADFDPGVGTFNIISAGSSDAFVSKLDVSGNFVWAKNLGGSATDIGYGIAVDPSGNVHTTGYYTGTADFDPNAGTVNLTTVSSGFVDIFVSKLDVSGNYVWAESMGGSVNDIGNAICLDASGNVYITGSFGTTADFDPSSGTYTLTSVGTSDAFISKLNASGNFVWAISFAGAGNTDEGRGITLDALGNVYSLGEFGGITDFDPGVGTYTLNTAGQNDVYISKLTSAGNFVWAVAIGGANLDFGRSIAVNNLGFIHTTGYFYNTADFDPGIGTFNLTSFGGPDAFVHKMNPAQGSALNFDGVNDYVDIGTSINTTLSTLNKLTAEAWVYPTSTVSYGAIVGNYSTPLNQMQFLIRKTGAVYQFFIGNGSSGNYLSASSTATVTLNTWQHIAGTWDGAVARIYVNGALSGTASVTYPTFNSTTNNIWIGGEVAGSGEYFAGNIDEVKIWNRALCVSEILNNMNGEIPTNSSGLLANYHFNQGYESNPNPTVTTLTDATSSVFTGTLNNFALTGSTSNWVIPGAVVSGNTVTPYVSPGITVNSGSICSGSSFTMNPAGVATYTLQGGSAIVSPGITTSYSVIGTTSLGCLTSVALSTINVNTTPTVSVNSGSICSGSSFTIVPAGASTYTINGGSATVFTPAANTSYSATGTSTAGCVSSNTAVSSVIVNTLPTVSVNSGAICAGNSFTIIPGGASTYTISGGSAVVTPGSNSSYNVTGTSAVGCVSSNTAVSSVTVNALPTVSVNSGAVCAGSSFTITPAGASTYTISGGNTVVTPGSNSSYNVTGTSSVGCISSNTAVSSVTVNALPTVSVNSGAVCAGRSFTIVPAGANTYTISGNNAVVTPTANASYSVTGTSTAGCVSSNTAVSAITVNVLPTVSVNSGTICSGKSFTIIPAGASTFTISGSSTVVSPTANASYSVTGTSTAGCVSSNTAVSAITVNVLPTVSVNSGTICSGKSFTIIPAGASTYTISGGSTIVSPTTNANYSVTGTSTAGCVSSNTAVSAVTINALPTVSVNGGTICSGKSFTIIPAGASTYTISGGSTVVSPTTSVSYSVTGTSTSGCVSSNTAVSSVTVNALPNVTAVSSSSLLCVGETASLTSNGAVSYSWNTSATNTVIAISPTVTTTYSVTGIGSNGCSNSAIVTQSVSKCTGLESTINDKQLGINVYPNPTNGTLNIDSEILNGESTTITLTNTLGQIVLNETISTQHASFNISNFMPGFYILKYENKGAVKTMRLIKE